MSVTVYNAIQYLAVYQKLGVPIIRNKTTEILQFQRVISSRKSQFLLSTLGSTWTPNLSMTIIYKNVYNIKGSIERILLPHHPRNPCY
jgi:hypothetical protein